MAAVMRVVLDTNVLVAAAYNPRSASRRIVEACLDGELTPVSSPALRREYEFILARAARGRPYLERIHRLVAGAEVVEPAPTPRVVADDPEDDKLVSAALAAGAVLVTNDAHLLAVAGHQGLKVVRPADMAEVTQPDYEHAEEHLRSDAAGRPQGTHQAEQHPKG